MYANGDIYRFDNDCKEAERCSYDEFMALLYSRGFVDTHTDYRYECD